MQFRPVFNPKSWRREYLELFETNGISTARAYVDRYGDEPIDDDPVLESVLAEMGTDLLGFERLYPAADQDVAIVFINPGLGWRTERDLDDNYQLYQREARDWAGRFSISMDGGFKYLFNTSEEKPTYEAFERLKNIIRKLGNETSLLSKLTLTLNRPVQFFADIYYTNWYKFATDGVNAIDGSVKDSNSFVSRVLRRELAVIDPEVVLVFGNQPWKNCFRPISSGIGPAPDGASVTNAQNHLYQCSLPSTSFYVIPYSHPSAWGRDKGAEHDPEQLDTSILLAKEEASSPSRWARSSD